MLTGPLSVTFSPLCEGKGGGPKLFANPEGLFSFGCYTATAQVSITDYNGCGRSFPGSNFILIPHSNLNFIPILIWNYYFIPILNMNLNFIPILTRSYFILAQKMNFIPLSRPKINFILLSRKSVYILDYTTHQDIFHVIMDSHSLSRIAC